MSYAGRAPNATRMEAPQRGNAAAFVAMFAVHHAQILSLLRAARDADGDYIGCRDRAHLGLTCKAMWRVLQHVEPCCSCEHCFFIPTNRAPPIPDDDVLGSDAEKEQDVWFFERGDR